MTAALLDFKTGKQLYAGNTSDERKFSLFDKNHLIIRTRYVCVLHLSKNQIRWNQIEKNDWSVAINSVFQLCIIAIIFILPIPIRISSYILSNQKRKDKLKNLRLHQRKPSLVVRKLIISSLLWENNKNFNFQEFTNLLYDDTKVTVKIHYGIDNFAYKSTNTWDKCEAKV